MLILLFGLFAHAQDVPELNAQHFRPSIDASRTLWVDDTTLTRGGTWRALVHYTRNPLVFEYDFGDTVQIISDVLQMDLAGGVTLGPIRLGADIPVYLFESGVNGPESGLGDIGLDGKVRFLERSKALGLALDARLFFPTATVDTALGSPETEWEVTAIADKEIGPALLALNLGIRGGPEVELDNTKQNDDLVFRAASAFAITDAAGAGLEVAGAQSLAGFGDKAAFSLELLGSGYGHLTDSFVLRGGAGMGVTRGIGSPDLRLMVGISYEPPAPTAVSKDEDLDGIVDRKDACPSEPEDFDGWEDGDGCADPDNDADGITDDLDACRNEAEDADGIADDDGCPESGTKVRVALVDGRDGSPLEGDGVRLVGADGEEWPLDPGRTAELSPGTYTLTAQVSGAELGPTTFEVADGDERLELRLVLFEGEGTASPLSVGEILFAPKDSTILPESLPALDELAATILADGSTIRVEGHTDSQGPAEVNMTLSMRRVQTVRDYLIGKGVDPDRIEVGAYGESRPLDPADTPEAHEKNRRVDIYRVRTP